MKTTMVRSKNTFYEFLFSAFLWLCIWATYNTDIGRFFNPGFPHSALDLIHGLRSLLPFLALILAIIILVKNRSLSRKFFTTPLGLIGIFTIVGIVSSVFSRNPFMALYWGVLYGAVIVVLLTVIENKDFLRKIIIINLIIAGILAVGLTAFFFIQPGALHSLTLNLLICAQRPYEGLANTQGGISTFDMAGTRPTGLGRYAGFVAIFALASFLLGKKRIKAAWIFIFVIFLSILLFSKGRTEVVAFIIAMGFVIWLAKKINIFSIFGTCLIFLLAFIIIFYNVPCTNNTPSFISKILLQKPATNSVVSGNTAGNTMPGVQPNDYTNTPQITFRPSAVTLSGRTTGVWSDAWHLFLKNPLMGFGFQADRFFLNGQHAHDSIMHALVQAGVLGTVPFLLAFILLLIIIIRLFKNPSILGEERNFLIAVTGALVFFAVRSITESVAFFSADWLFVAPMIAYVQCLDGEASAINNSKKFAYILGNKIDLIKTYDVVEKIKYWIKNESQKLHWIVVTGMHGIVEAEKHASFKYIISYANMFVPDGISLVWLAKLKGFDIKKRVSGADLMQEFLKVAGKEGFSSYFYGDTEETLQALNQKLMADFPNLKIAGSYSPPFKSLTQEEDAEIIKKINQAKPDVLWVALGLPKQEKWIFEHREKLNVPVVIGVGAAFKFLSGKVKRAPAWVGNIGLEWLWRLLKEPKTTWKRVFLDMPFFVWLALLEIGGFKSYKE